MSGEVNGSEKVTESIVQIEKVKKPQAATPRKRKSSKKKAAKKPSTATAARTSKAFQIKPFPTATFESVLSLATAIFDHAGALREMKRDTIFTKLGKSPNSGPSRMLITNSSKYGLTIGGYQAEILKLSDKGLLVVDPVVQASQSTQAKFQLAIESIVPFNGIYQKFKGGKLPAPEVMKDSLHEIDIDERQECVDIFIGNAKYIGLLKVISGAEWVLGIDDLLETKVTNNGASIADNISRTDTSAESIMTDYDSVCFFVAPIGNEGDEKRKHSDMILETLVEHAIKPLQLKVVRADKITQPGMISKQILSYIIKSKLVIADMSFHNPNVFYELAIRHLIGKPTVHLIRKRDKIPFDVGNFRTIEIDDSDMYELIAKIETYRVDIANHVREALEGSSSADNPILTFFPDLKVTLNMRGND